MIGILPSSNSHSDISSTYLLDSTFDFIIATLSLPTQRMPRRWSGRQEDRLQSDPERSAFSFCRWWAYRTTYFASWSP